MKLYLFDTYGRLLGYIEKKRLYDIKGNLITEITNENITVKTLLNILLNANQKYVV